MKRLALFVYQPKILLVIIILQSVALAAVFASLNASQDYSSTQVLAQTADDLDEEIRNCLKMPIVERPTCAKMIGMQLASQSIEVGEKVRNCMKLRPIFVRFCLNELR